MTAKCFSSDKCDSSVYIGMPDFLQTVPADIVRQLSSRLPFKKCWACLPEVLRKSGQYWFRTQESQVYWVVPLLFNYCAFLHKMLLLSCFTVILRLMQSSALLKWNIFFCFLQAKGEGLKMNQTLKAGEEKRALEKEQALWRGIWTLKNMLVK